MIKKVIFFIFIFILGSVCINPILAFNRDSTDLAQQAKKQYTKGVIYGRQGMIDSALIYSTSAVELFQEIKAENSISLAHAYQSLGIIYKISGKYEQAIAYYNKAEKIYRANNRTGLLAYIYGNKANIYFIQQDFAKARDFHLRALSIFETDTEKYQIQISSTYNNLGNIYRLNNDFKNAIYYYNKSLQLKEEKNLTYSTFANLAICYENLGEFNKAEQFYLKAIYNIQNNFNDQNLWLALHYGKYALFLSKQNREEEAMNYFRKALTINRVNFGEKNPETSESYNNIGHFYHQNNELDKALHYYQKALISLSENFNDTTLSVNPDIVNVSSKTHLLDVLKNKAIALSNLALQNDKIEIFNHSIKTFQLAIGVTKQIRSGYLSEQSKLQLVQNSQEIISKAIKTSYQAYLLTHEKEYLDQAFLFSELGKSAVLLEAIKGNHALAIGNIPDSLKQKESRIEKEIFTYEELIYEENKNENPDQQKLAYWNKSLFELKQNYSDLITLLENQYPAYHDLKYNQDILELRSIRNNLSDDEVILAYTFAGDKLYSFLLDKDKIKINESELDTTFFASLESVLKTLSNNNFSNHTLSDFKHFQENSFFLYQKLIEPFKDEINEKHLIIIPDNKLAYLPFDILISQNKEYNRINYRQLPYLINNHQLSYSYSATLLFEKTHKPKTAKKRLSAFAPTYDNLDNLNIDELTIRQQYREKLFPLKGIKEEAENVAKIVGGDSFLNLNASEGVFKNVASDYDILHLAMHTIIDDENPMYSKMAFTQNNDSLDDGLLNTYEVYNMRLNCRMAVLSSCNSGTGKLHRGEGVISLARGFIYAGCPSIIMTLWSVEDKSGVDLMTSFYQNLKAGENKSQALRQAKLDFIQNADQLKAHPYFWAGYVVIGDDTPLFNPYKKYLFIAGAILILGISGILIFLYRKKKTLILNPG